MTEPRAAGARASVGQTLRRVRFRHRIMRAPLVRLRHRGLMPHDAFLASYPRSGATWLRFLLFETLTGEPTAFGRVRTGVPSIGKQGAAVPVLPHGGRMLQTHERYCDRDRKVVYVVRDARSVAVSEYRWQRFAGFYEGELERFVQDFVAGRSNPWGSWGGHVGFWRDSIAARNGHLHTVRYEDLRADTVGVLGDILRFLGVEREEPAVRAAVESNSIDGMRAKEDESVRRRGAAPKKDLRFVNTGATKGWRESLSAAQVGLIEERFGPTLRELGYEPARRGDERAAARPRSTR